MAFGIRELLFIVAVILFLVSILPPIPHSNILAGLGLAFLAAGHVAGG